MKKISLAVPITSIENKKAELASGSTFSSSAMLKSVQHPPLSVLSLRRVWLCRKHHFCE